MSGPPQKPFGPLLRILTFFLRKRSELLFFFKFFAQSMSVSTNLPTDPSDLMFERLYKVQNSRLMWKIHRELFFVVQDKTLNKYLSREHVARRVQTR